MNPTIVIGGGLMGSATAWQLAQQGESVILLEQQDTIYTSGSSHGESRISRSLGPQDDIFAYLQIQGIKETQQLIDFLNEHEPETHSMEDIYRTSPVTYIFYPQTSEEIAVFNLDKPDTLAHPSGNSLAFAPDSETARTKFGLHLPDSLQTIREYRKYSGTMNPRALIQKLHRAITYTGNEVRYNQKVKQLKRTDQGYQLTILDTKNQTEKVIEAPKIVVAAGPYNGQVLKETAPVIDQLITPSRLFLTFLKIRPAVYNSWSEEQKNKLLDGFPIIKMHDELFYSMIEQLDSDGIPILKVGGHFKRTPIENLNEVWRVLVSEEELEWSQKELIEYLKMSELEVEITDLEVQKGYSCVYSLSQSEVPYVANLPLATGEFDKNAVLVGGMSGVGAKGTMTYGLMAANLLLGKEGPDDRMYKLTEKALGNERLKSDLEDLDRLPNSF
ncbi:FAD-dependent oxidoreductase [Ekhidna sp.]|uniref:NAD(P)/FAD-dependent oxidoreductase n=1 Tax=Ekhidna sp. TaxID=2608089 RepID=UPI003298FFE9